MELEKCLLQKLSFPYIYIFYFYLNFVFNLKICFILLQYGDSNFL